jgi:hypothetical protein
MPSSSNARNGISEGVFELCGSAGIRAVAYQETQFGQRRKSSNTAHIRYSPRRIRQTSLRRSS